MELNTGKEVLREPLVSPGQQWALWASRPPTPGPSRFKEQCPHRDQEEAAGRRPRQACFLRDTHRMECWGNSPSLRSASASVPAGGRLLQKGGHPHPVAKDAGVHVGDGEEGTSPRAHPTVGLDDIVQTPSLGAPRHPLGAALAQAGGGLGTPPGEIPRER